MLPTQYSAIQLQRFARTFRQASNIISMPLDPPKAQQIAVRNTYCGVNAIFDTQIARDAVDYVTLTLPVLTGVEALGIVEMVGQGVTQFSPGDVVVTTRFPSGYRQWNTGHVNDFYKVPDARPEWLVLASTGVSAYVALHHIGEIKAGETVAISAAAGGLGHLLVQIAKNLGCHVVAICGGDDKAAFVQSLGADCVINYRTTDVAEFLDQHYNDKLDIAFDTVSGAIHDAFLDNLAPHGRLVVGGAAADLDGKPEVVSRPRIANKLYYKSASVRGFMNGLLADKWPAARHALFDDFTAGKLNVCIDKPQFCGLDGVYDAIDRLLSGKSIGKVLADLR